MIRLDIKPYCHQCDDFDADVIAGSKLWSNVDNSVVMTDTIVQCSHRRRCEAIRKYLLRQNSMKEQNNDV